MRTYLSVEASNDHGNRHAKEHSFDGAVAVIGAALLSFTEPCGSLARARPCELSVG